MYVGKKTTSKHSKINDCEHLCSNNIFFENQNFHHIVQQRKQLFMCVLNCFWFYFVVFMCEITLLLKKKMRESTTIYLKKKTGYEIQLLFFFMVNFVFKIMTSWINAQFNFYFVVCLSISVLGKSLFVVIDMHKFSFKNNFKNKIDN